MISKMVLRWWWPLCKSLYLSIYLSIYISIIARNFWLWTLLGKLFGKLTFHEYLTCGWWWWNAESFHFISCRPKFSILSLQLLLLERFFDVLLLFAVVELGHLRHTHTHSPTPEPDPFLKCGKLSFRFWHSLRITTINYGLGPSTISCWISPPLNSIIIIHNHNKLA